MSRFSDWLGKTFKGKRIAMLGLAESGKTQFLSSLGCKDAIPGTPSNKDVYRWFKVSYPDISVFVKAGCDYGGNKPIFTRTFIEALRTSDWVFFMVDIQKFIQNKVDSETGNPYKSLVLERLDFINSNVPAKFKDKLAIVLTHADLMDDSEFFLVNEFRKYTSDKVYAVLTQHCYSLDAKDVNQVKTVFRRVAGI